MLLSIDFGGSTTDAIYWDQDEVLSLKTFESKDLDLSKLNFADVDKIFITGGKSGFMKENFSNILVVKVGEIEAIGCGGRALTGGEEAILVVSMGTGTCMVESRITNGGIKVKHLGGTGVGGGTFVGLGKELLGISDIDELLRLGAKGSSENVDISVKEIVGSGIGRISADATASNLGKLSSEINFKREDLAAGIINLIGQTIGVSVAFAAQAGKISKVVLTGKLTKAVVISDIVFDIVKSYGVEVFIPENAPYVSAIGAKVASDYGLV
ncbi:MAG: pantothenate kinase, type II pantothenate kinase [Candidatus Peregrinibacteria bacterium GW2011_GWF2_43_17]|nr:MAG: pantothenate kinase, type II pantothenate kinase [Candidatus Peregrinibacteria bacterium GW2011_GWF2_43_17]KKT19396.1 MAG: ATPase BadF/BadG/BcrA/BcrD type [Candidatus Peregrinibacteria bacterium GW2011_GWA2_43_8]HAU40236.1 hypothetical protein [Candidatus Peregrinibacteria bacterium]